jgi:hypothetical protein
MRLRAVLGIAAAGLFLAPALSSATDYCITFPVSGFVVVGRGFAVPAKGQCKPWNGFSAQGGINSPSTGVGCTSSDGSHFNLTFITTFPQGPTATFFEEDQMSLALPTQTGNDSFTTFSGGSVSSGGPATANGAKCSKVAIPADVEPGPTSALGNSVQ